MDTQVNVLVNGIGNIGTTLAAMLSVERKLLGIDRVFALKNEPQPWMASELAYLRSVGVETCTKGTESGILHLDDVIPVVNYAFDCTATGNGIHNKPMYNSWPQLLGASAQGSEKGFGMLFSSGWKPRSPELERFVQIASCNTHALAGVVNTLAGTDAAELEHADFVFVRRSEDVGGKGKMVGSNVVARHRDPQVGTHHAIDVIELLGHGFEGKITSSDVTTPSQTMHAVRFSVRTSSPTSVHDVTERIKAMPYVGSTLKFDSGSVFEWGRRVGFQGRLFEHVIIVINNLMVLRNSIIGWAFVPQEGNTILSTIEAFLRQVHGVSVETVMADLRNRYIVKDL